MLENLLRLAGECAAGGRPSITLSGLLALPTQRSDQIKAQRLVSAAGWMTGSPLLKPLFFVSWKLQQVSVGTCRHRVRKRCCQNQRSRSTVVVACSPARTGGAADGSGRRSRGF